MNDDFVLSLKKSFTEILTLTLILTVSNTFNLTKQSAAAFIANCIVLVL